VARQEEPDQDSALGEDDQADPDQGERAKCPDDVFRIQPGWEQGQRGRVRGKSGYCARHARQLTGCPRGGTRWRPQWARTSESRGGEDDQASVTTPAIAPASRPSRDRKSTRLNSS